MKIAVGNDHRGVAVKQRLEDMLKSLGHTVDDFGATSAASVDYPDFAIPVAEAVASGKDDRGLLICATGHGMCIAANKVKGVRAALAHDELTAQISRTHNDTNVLCLSADLLGQRLIEKVVDVWLTTEFQGGRHERRLKEIEAIERGDDPSRLG